MDTKKLKLKKQKNQINTIIKDFETKIKYFQSFKRQLSGNSLLTVAQEFMLLSEEYERQSKMFRNFLLKQFQNKSDKKDRMREMKKDYINAIEKVKDDYTDVYDEFEKEGWNII